MKTTAVDTSVWNAISEAGVLVQGTLFLLIVLSVVSWAIILAKWFQFRNQAQENKKFLLKFDRSQSLIELKEEAEDLFENSSLARIYSSVIEEFQNQKEMKQKMGPSFDLSLACESLERELNRSIRNEIGLLEARLSWLASTGSTAPFIGLFGTVWGLMNSFHKIGAMGSASLAVVAPGISEALVATAVGLFAAIPATLFYNQFISKIRVVELEMNDLSSDLLSIMKRHLGT